MMAAFDQQLARSDELPHIPGVLAHLTEQVSRDEAFAVYERFLWELRREKESSAALANAKFSVSLAQTLRSQSVDEALSALKARIGRLPLSLTAGAHASISDSGKATVLNMTDRPVDVATAELVMAAEQVTHPVSLTVVIDDQPASARRAADQHIVWQIPAQAEDAEESWRALLEVADGYVDEGQWVSAYSSLRHLAAESGTLPSELDIRAQRARQFAQNVMMTHAFGPVDDQMIQATEQEAERAISLFDKEVQRYTEQPRMVLACRSLRDLSPAEQWQAHGPAGLRALISSVTGDDPYVTAALAAAPRLRLGTLAFTGDPDAADDDLLSASLPPGHCFAVLRPETLARTLFFAGVPHPSMTLPVPQRRFGFYNNVAVGRDVVDLLRVRTYLNCTPATPDSVRDYFHGREQELLLKGSDLNYGFQALLSAVAIARKDETDVESFEAAVRVAALNAVFTGLGRDSLLDGVGAVHLGALNLTDVEQLVVPLDSAHDFEVYHRSGRMPSYLQPVADFFGAYGVRVRPRAPVEHGSMAVIG